MNNQENIMNNPKYSMFQGAELAFSSWTYQIFNIQTLLVEPYVHFITSLATTRHMHREARVTVGWLEVVTLCLSRAVKPTHFAGTLPWSSNARRCPW